MNTFDNLILQIERKGLAWRDCNAISFGTDGDYKVYTPRKKKGSIERKVLVVGTGRCGTMTLSKMFLTNGFDVPHEIEGADGMVSHWFAYDSEWHPYVIGQPLGHIHLGEHRSDYQFENILHLVRNPLDCIPSIATFFHDSDYEFLKEQGIKDIKRNDLRSAMKIYFEVNLRCEKVRTSKNILRIEDIGETFKDLCFNLFGLHPSVVFAEKENRSSHARITWDDIFETDWQLGYGISMLATKYGYVEELKGTRYDLPNFQTF